METLKKIKDLVESLSVDMAKFYEKENKSAGVRVRKSAQEIKSLCQVIRKEILEETKK